MFDLIPASTQYVTVPGTVVTQDSLTVSIWLQPDFAPDSATVYNVVDVVGVRYRLYHSAANTWTMYADGRTKTFDVTGLWIAGQLVHVKATWVKTGDVMTLAIHGTEITPSAGSGTWGTTAVGATLRFGADASAADTFDGELGTPAVWNRALTAAELAALVAGNPAKECALSGLMWSALFDINEQPDHNPGGEVATMVGSPLISQHPLILRRGARVLVEGFQGALGASGQFENPRWTRTGTPTASTKIETVAAPAGTPLALGSRVLQIDHLDAENAIYYTREFGTLTRGFLSVSIRPGTLSASVQRFLWLAAAGSNTLNFRESAGTIRLYNVDTLLVTVSVAANLWYTFELAWDTLANTTQLRVDGALVYSGATSPASAPTQIRCGCATTAQTFSLDLAGLDIRSDRAPDLLYDGAFDLDGTADNLTAPQEIATTLNDLGAIHMRCRPDKDAGGYSATTYWWHFSQGTAYAAAYMSSTANRIYLRSNGRTCYWSVAGLWVAGQWVELLFQWDKSTDTFELYVNGVAVGGPTKSGTWGSEAASSAIGFAASATGLNRHDMGLGRVHVLSQLLTAGEIVELSKGKHPRQVCPSKWIESWRPGSLTGEKGAYSLTKVGAPALDVGPGIQDAVGAVEVRSHFEGVGYEQPWTLAGTPTADTFIDPDATAPAGWPAWAGRPCRFKQLATENAMSISKVLSASGFDTYWHREVIYVATLPAATISIVDMLGTADLTVRCYLTATKLQLAYHVAAGYISVNIADLAVGKVYYVEIGYSVSGGWVGYRVNGHLGNKPYTYITGVTLDRGGLRSLYLRTSGVTTYSVDMYRGAIEGRTDGAPAIPPELGIAYKHRMLYMRTG